MRITIPSLADKETLTFEEDILNRKPFAEMLTNLVQGGEESLVMSIDAQWGEGKTTFVKMWQSLLEEKGIPNVYVDAFENDYVDDAFVALVSAIFTYIDEQELGPEKIDRLKENAAKVSKQLLSWTVGIIIKLVTMGVIRGNLEDIEKELAKGFSGTVEKFLENRLSSHEQDKSSLQAFKEELANLPGLLAERQQQDSPAETTSPQEIPPLVVIVDELDRCKPTFAVEIIERVKHLFSVKNVVFVLVMNTRQLEESVKAVYGQTINAHTYLQKFIKVETRLPKATIPKDESSKHRSDGFTKYCEHLFKAHELSQEIQNQSRILLTQHLPDIARNCDLSLREMENVFTNLALFYKAQDRHRQLQSDLAVSLSVIKVKSPDLLTAIANDDISYGAIDEVIGFSRHVTDRHWGIGWYSGLIKFCLFTLDELTDDQDKESYRQFGRNHAYHDHDLAGRRNQLRLCAQRLLWFSTN